jgi:hypothetical protein
MFWPMSPVTGLGQPVDGLQWRERLHSEPEKKQTEGLRLADDVADMTAEIPLAAVEIGTKGPGEFQLASRLKGHGRVTTFQGDKPALLPKALPLARAGHSLQQGFDPGVGGGFAGLSLEH